MIRIPECAWGEELLLEGVERTRLLGRELACHLCAGDVLLLAGELGTGKTSLVQGLAEGLEIAGRVTSPTFAICNRYSGRLELHHYDLYRIESPEQLAGLGFEESLESGAVLAVEWPLLCLPLLRDDALAAVLRHHGKARAIRLGQWPPDRITRELRAQVSAGAGCDTSSPAGRREDSPAAPA